MKYKHKFYLLTKENNEKIELATCADEMTAGLLGGHFSKVYKDKEKFELTYKFKQKTRVL